MINTDKLEILIEKCQEHHVAIEGLKELYNEMVDLHNLIKRVNHIEDKMKKMKFL